MRNNVKVNILYCQTCLTTPLKERLDTHKHRYCRPIREYTNIMKSMYYEIIKRIIKMECVGERCGG